jgi:hypothetical protein
MLARNQQEIAKALCSQSAGFAQDFFDRQGYSQNWVVPRKAAILAVIDAFV